MPLDFACLLLQIQKLAPADTTSIPTIYASLLILAVILIIIQQEHAKVASRDSSSAKGNAFIPRQQLLIQIVLVLLEEAVVHVTLDFTYPKAKPAFR